MNYQEFKDHLIGFSWRAGDTEFEASLDNLIKMGDASLQRDLKIQDRKKSGSMMVNDVMMPFPEDCRSIISVSPVGWHTLRDLEYVQPSRIYSTINRTNRQAWLPIYSIENRHLLFCGPVNGGHYYIGPTPPPSPQEGDLWNRTGASAGLYVWTVDPTSAQWVQTSPSGATHDAIQSADMRYVTIEYYTSIPNFKDDGASWVTDDYLDIYTYAVLQHAAGFVREDERLKQWQALYKSAVQDALYEDTLDRSGGPYQEYPVNYAHPAGVARKRR